MTLKRLCFYLLCCSFFLVARPVAAQTVLFDGVVNEGGQASALLVPAVVTADDYSPQARLEYGVLGRVNLFGELGGRFDGGSTGLAGLGWSATLYNQTDQLPVNIGFFNSYVFPLRDIGPDAFVTVAPVFSHTFGDRVTPYAGATATFRVNAPGNDVNALLGVRVNRIADRWDFITEVQPGERTQFALGFVYRF